MTIEEMRKKAEALAVEGTSQRRVTVDSQNVASAIYEVGSEICSYLEAILNAGEE